MNDEARQLRLKIVQHQNELNNAMLKLKRLQFECSRRPQSHSWTQAEYTPIITEGFEYGDKPGTMGSDYIPKHWVPRQETPCWRRGCTNCGLVEETKRTRDEVKKIPEF